jgi:hypothetical protein
MMLLHSSAKNLPSCRLQRAQHVGEVVEVELNHRVAVGHLFVLFVRQRAEGAVDYVVLHVALNVEALLACDGAVIELDVALVLGAGQAGSTARCGH